MVSLELEARLDNLLATAQEETKDIDIFTPIQEREECPICMIPLPIKESEIVFKLCCGKTICIGCAYKHMLTDMSKKGPSQFRDDYRCPFCQVTLISTKNNIKATKKLMKKENPKAYIAMARAYKKGEGVFQSDTKSLEMYIRAAELGFAEAYNNIAAYYGVGIVVEQDLSKAVAFDEVSAKKGAVLAHITLAHFYTNAGDVEMCINHLTIAASAGDQEAMDKLMNMYKNKDLSKEELSQTLQAFQASKNEVRSKDRDEALAFLAAD